MQCPMCHSDDTCVKDSRPTGLGTGNHSIRRRRLCEECDTRFTTFEIQAELYLSITGATDQLNKTMQSLRSASDLIGAVLTSFDSLTKETNGDADSVHNGEDFG